ncbi:MAG TPA: helix-turn-helix domain-containing protein [Vicinamibacterales bacterium]|jgi:cytoskeleton protein RodZ|nr:helix-turn-helix domain-containing protein [Vicinamibacterales bacterium]
MSVATDTLSVSERSRVQARSETKPVPPPVWVGTKLHDARERVGISLRQIADTTKLSVTTLMALERNEFSRLPGGVFARGYVRSFATEVGLDPEAIVAEFVEQAPIDSVKDGYGGAEAAAKAEAATREETVDASRTEPPTAMGNWTGNWTNSRNVLWFAGVGFVLGAIGVMFVTTAAYVTSSNRSPRTQTKQSRSEVTGTTGLASARPVRPDAPGKNVVRAPGRDIKLPSSDAASHMNLLPPTIATGNATTIVTKPAEAATAKDASPTNSELSADSSAGEPSVDGQGGQGTAAVALAGNRLAVTLSVTRPSWVIALVDGKKALSRQLEVGEEETLTARQNFVLTTGDAGAIVMTINGAATKTLGESGEAVTARINRRNFSDYLRQD